MELYSHDEIKQEALDLGVPPETFAWLDILTNEQRAAALHAYCLHCGAPDTGCRCWNGL